MKTKEENLFQTYLSKIINSAFESGLVEREKKFKPEIISKDLLDIINHIKAQTREETIREIKEKLNKVIKYNSEISEDYQYAYSDLINEINKLKK